MKRREHFIVALDRARMRIYRESKSLGQSHQNLELVEAIDFPDSLERFSSRAVEERLPIQREHDRRRANDLAAELDSFLANRPHATWDLAAGPTICRAVVSRLSRDTHRRLLRSMQKDVANQPAREIHFPAA